jgi:hypothetical protein
MGWNDVEQTGGSGSKDKVEYTKFPEGVTVIRVLDNEPYSFWSHWMTKHGKGVTCLGKGCPICAVIAQQKANKEARTYSSTKRHAMRVWNYTTKRMEIMVQGQGFAQQLLNLHKEVGDITTYDIKVTRKGLEVSDTNYMCLPMAPKPFEFGSEVTEVNFEEAFKTLDKDQIIKLMEGATWEEVFGKTEESEE